MFAREGGRSLPLIYDFDESGMVTGRHDWFDDVLNENFSPVKSHPDVEVLAQLQHPLICTREGCELALDAQDLLLEWRDLAKT